VRATAHFAGGQRGQRRARHERQHRRQPHQHQRAAREGAVQRDERRLVRVAPGRVFADEAEVELVAVVAVASGEHREHDSGRQGDGEDRPPGSSHWAMMLANRPAVIAAPRRMAG
jgi:hypothetical protein